MKTTKKYSLLFGGILFMGCMTLFTSCNNQQDGDKIDSGMIINPLTDRPNAKKVTKMPEITFDTTRVDFGTILQGDTVPYSFHFKNTGKAPLLISQVTGSCGCTVMRGYPTKPLAPGESGDINILFDSANKWGKQTVVISVVCNTRPATTLLDIKVNILAPETKNKS